MSSFVSNWLAIGLVPWVALSHPTASPARPSTLDGDGQAFSLQEAVNPVLTELEIPGAVVALIQGDRIAHREVFGWQDLEAKVPMTRDALFQIGSVTKCFTATLACLLDEEGVLSLDDSVTDYLPESLDLPDWWQDITLRSLANHTSGLPREPVNRKNLPDTPSVMLPYSIEELYAGLQQMEQPSAVAGAWSYSNLNFALLGHILELAGGSSFEELLSNQLLQPLSMASTGIRPSVDQEARFACGYWPEDEKAQARTRWEFGEVAGFGGVFTDVEDLSKFVLAWINPGGENNPISTAIATRMQDACVETGARPGQSMTIGWFQEVFPGAGAVFGHGGEVDSYSACIAFLPSLKIGVVVLANQGGASAETLCQSVLKDGLPMLLARGQ